MSLNVTDRYAPGKPFHDGLLCDGALRLSVEHDRSDTRWAGLEEPYERLAWARSSHPRFKNRSDFARLVGEKPETFAKYERDYRVGTNGSRLTADRARQFGAALSVRWEWLLWGEGAPWSDDGEPVERITNALRGRPRDEQERIAAAVEALVKTGTNG